jgi:hypothetical protein
MNSYQAAIQLLDDSDLTDRMVRVAIALLRRCNDRGELHILRAEACRLCQVEDANTVSKYLARLSVAGVLDWKGGNGAFHIWFTSWSPAAEILPRPAKNTPPAAVSAAVFSAATQPPAASKWTPWALNTPPAAN